MALLPRNAEIIIGIVARIGIETPHVSEVISECLEEYSYSSLSVKITDSLGQIEAYNRIPQRPMESRYKSYISACNELRERVGLKDIMARLAIAQIRSKRAEAAEVDPGDELGLEKAAIARRAFILNQLKRPEEAELLRSVYGEQYIQVSCHSPVDKRARALAERIAHDHHENPRADAWIGEAHNLIRVDDAEEDNPCGQRVRDIFPSSDVVIDATSRANMKRDLERFFSALFGDFSVTPTPSEYGMELASTAALRSSDLSRQVGAAILNSHNEIQALGCNEVPKSLGGTYWEGDIPDGREPKLGIDSNDRRKREVLSDLAFRMRRAGILSEEYIGNDTRLFSDLFDRSDDLISESQMMDSLEYGRTIHAEMNAITDAARSGHAIRGTILYCNTFPCHNCAKHIVASGVVKVLYLKPYPKSYASDLFADSVEIDPDGPTDKVVFQQFLGISGPMYRRVFQKGKWKNKDGTVPRFLKSDASFVRSTPIPAHIKAEILLSKELGEIIERVALSGQG